MQIGIEGTPRRSIAVPVGLVAQGEVAANLAQHAQQIGLGLRRSHRARRAHFARPFDAGHGLEAAEIVETDEQQRQCNENPKPDGELATDIEAFEEDGFERSCRPAEEAGHGLAGRCSGKKVGWLRGAIVHWAISMLRPDRHGFRCQSALFQVSESHGVGSNPSMSARSPETSAQWIIGTTATSSISRSFIWINSFRRLSASISVVEAS